MEMKVHGEVNQVEDDLEGKERAKGSGIHPAQTQPTVFTSVLHWFCI